MVRAIDQEARNGRQTDELNEDVIEEISSLHNIQGARPQAGSAARLEPASRWSQFAAAFGIHARAPARDGTPRGRRGSQARRSR